MTEQTTTKDEQGQDVTTTTTRGEYTYNGNGQRMKKVTSGHTTYFVFDQQGKLIEESGITTVDYVYLNDSPLAKIENGTINYIHSDHLGTPAKMTNAQKQLTWEISVMPFGEMLNITGTTTNNIRFSGQYYDAETGLNYNYRRDYNPMIGRYIESDPVGLSGGINLYAYVSNNPINALDPLGLYCITLPSFAKWEPYDKSKPDYSVNFVFSDVTGAIGLCAWIKRWKEYQSRTYKVKQLCCDTGNMKCKDKSLCYYKDGNEVTEVRAEEKTDSEATKAWGWIDAAHPKKVGTACCTNPWDGKIYCTGS